MTGIIKTYDLTPNNKPLQVITHTYDSVTKQTKQPIKISGKFDGIDNKLACDDPNIGNCFIKETTANGNVINEIGKLVQVLSWGDFDYKTLNNMFYNAAGLYEIPNDQLPNVNYAMYTFAGCTQLIELKNEFALPNVLLNATGMFASTGLSDNAIQNLQINKNLCVIDDMFRNCSKLKVKPNNFYTNRYMNVDYITGKDNSNAFTGTAVNNPNDIY